MRVVEVVVSGFFDTIGLYDKWGDAQRNGAQGWLRALGLGDYCGDNFDALSFGLQRMVLLARAMVNVSNRPNTRRTDSGSGWPPPQTHAQGHRPHCPK